MSRLIDCFSALLAFGLELDASIAAGRAGLPCDAARQRVRELIDAAREAARTQGQPAGQTESALFAMVAWIDEILGRHPDCTDGFHSLQRLLFNSDNAGTEFFQHLSRIPAADNEVREVYWYALLLGFKGQYYFENGDAGELGKLKDLHGQQLAMRPLDIAALAREHITPQPYAGPAPTPRSDTERRERALLRAGGVLALLVPLVYLLGALLPGPRGGEPKLSQRLEQQLQSYACAELSATVSPDNTVEISGFVSHPEEIARVQREVRALPAIGATRFDIKLRAWPYCEVVAILKPHQTRNREQHYGLKVLASTARDGRLREGDPVLIRTTNASYDGYLWIDYYTADGAVMHLNVGKGQPLVRAGETVELGRDIPSSWLVAPPFGTVLLTALSSPAPFTDTAERPPFELASSYLQWLRESLAAGDFGKRVTADFVFLETVPLEAVR